MIETPILRQAQSGGEVQSSTQTPPAIKAFVDGAAPQSALAAVKLARQLMKIHLLLNMAKAFPSVKPTATLSKVSKTALCMSATAVVSSP